MVEQRSSAPLHLSLDSIDLTRLACDCPAEQIDDINELQTTNPPEGQPTAPPQHDLTDEVLSSEEEQQFDQLLEPMRAVRQATDQATAPPADKALLVAYISGELDPEAARIVTALCVRYKTWADVYGELLELKAIADETATDSLS